VCDNNESFKGGVRSPGVLASIACTTGGGGGGVMCDAG
jgi:hypothetical protein